MVAVIPTGSWDTNLTDSWDSCDSCAIRCGLTAVHIDLPVADLVYLVEESPPRAGEAPHTPVLVADDEALQG